MRLFAFLILTVTGSTLIRHKGGGRKLERPSDGHRDTGMDVASPGPCPFAADGNSTINLPHGYALPDLKTTYSVAV